MYSESWYWPGHDEAAGLRRVLDESDQPLDAALKSGGWVRSERERELVLDLSEEGASRTRCKTDSWEVALWHLLGTSAISTAGMGETEAS